MSIFIGFAFILQLAICCNAWPPYSTIFGTSQHFQSNSPYSIWHRIRTVKHEEQNQQPKQEEPQIKHLTNLRYNGLNYVMVHNLSLPYEQAEHYCNSEFSKKMHLVSIQSESEWKVISKAFTLAYPSEAWLGGQSYYADVGLFLIKWVDDKPFEYHRFSSEEMSRWQANWRFGGHGCIFGVIQADGRGNWSVQLAPCSEPRRFICKEEDHKSRGAKPEPKAQAVQGHLNGLASFMHMLFGSRVFFEGPSERQNRIMQLPTGHWHQITLNRPETAKSGTSLMVTKSPSPSKVPINVPVQASDKVNSYPSSAMTKTSEPNPAVSSVVGSAQANTPMLMPNSIAIDQVNRSGKPTTAIAWSIPNNAPKNDGQIQSTKVGFNVISSPKAKNASAGSNNLVDQKDSTRVPAGPSQSPVAQVVMDGDDTVDYPTPYPDRQDSYPDFRFRSPGLHFQDLRGHDRGKIILL